MKTFNKQQGRRNAPTNMVAQLCNDKMGCKNV